QRRIAAILDQAETLRTQRRQALTHLDTLTQSLFLDMFGDPVVNPKGWSKRKIGELGGVHTGKTPPSQDSANFVGSIPFVTPGDLDGDLTSTVRHLSDVGATYCAVVRPGSSLVSCIGNIGKLGKAQVPTAFNQQINAVEWSACVDDTFGLAALEHARPQMLALSSATTLPILNKSNFSKVEVVVPPLAVQQTFATRIQAIEALKATHRTALTQLDALFASLQQRAFAGEL
uniref:restriction endonuclease subunit S n=1 Tax=Rhodoferax sp. OV413 TaxID=1855285 RepID=UPI0025DDC5C0